MLTKDDIGPIKIKEFGRGKGTPSVYGREEKTESGTPGEKEHLSEHEQQFGAARVPREPKIIDYDQEHAEQELRKRVGKMKIVDVDKETEREHEREWKRTRDADEREVGPIKIIESDA